jgi:hypothetical protein
MDVSTIGRACAAASVSLVLVGCQVTEDQLENYVRSRGFTPVLSPSQLYAPGAFVYRLNYDPRDPNPKRVSLGFLCDPRYVPYDKKPLEGETLGQFTVTQFGGTLSAGLPQLRQVLDLTAKTKGTARVTANISDARIYSFAKENLSEMQAVLGPVCSANVRKNMRDKNAYQIIQALRASVDISVKMDGGLDASAAARLGRELANIGFSITGQQEALLKATALFVGVHRERSGRVSRGRARAGRTTDTPS